jgi:hypothetical protein
VLSASTDFLISGGAPILACWEPPLQHIARGLSGPSAPVIEGIVFTFAITALVFRRRLSDDTQRLARAALACSIVMAVASVLVLWLCPSCSGPCDVGGAISRAQGPLTDAPGIGEHVLVSVVTR